VVEFLTDAPVKQEKEISAKQKEISVFSPEGLHYTNVEVYTNVQEVTSNRDSIRVYWKEENGYLDFNAEDKNGNGLIDYVDWIAPHLSNQTFEIIFITKAEQLDENRQFVMDVYEQVKDRDGIWQNIPENNYLRVSFQKNLTNQNDITIYARSNSSGRVELKEVIFYAELR
jgi:hypothetical protein